MKSRNPYGDSLNLWDRLTLILRKGDRKSEFLTRVEDIKRDSYVLETPIRHSGDLHLAKGDAVDVIYNRADAVYSFKASIFDLFAGDTNTLIINRKSATNRIQRRQYVRLDISGKISFRPLDYSDSKDSALGPESSGILLNISAGGLLFESPIKVKHHDFLVLSFSLKGSQVLENVLGVVKRCEGSRTKGYLIGAEFLTKHNLKEYNLEKIEEFLPPGSGTFDENLQKLIVQFIYNQQVELRKKGLLNK
jgi:c-di-GMP-binding flagellar brake protein YcgR